MSSQDRQTLPQSPSPTPDSRFKPRPCPSDCRYAGIFDGVRCCDYWAVAGHCRGCPPGPECIRYEPVNRRTRRRVSITLQKTPTKPVDYDAISRLYDAGYNDIQIAKQVGCGQSTVNRWRIANDLPVNRGGVANKNQQKKRHFDEDKARALYALGMLDAAIAREVGVSKTTIQEWRTKRGLKCNKRLYAKPKKGECNKNENNSDPKP